MSEDQNVTVTVAYKETRVEFKGPPSSVLGSVMSFLEKEIPSLDLARKISVNYSFPDLVSTFGDYVKITPEGPRVFSGDRKFGDKQTVGLELVAARLGNYAGKLERPSMTVQEIQSATGLNPKSVSSRLSEMVKQGHVEREPSDSGVMYKITTQGISWLGSELAKKAGR